MNTHYCTKKHGQSKLEILVIICLLCSTVGLTFFFFKDQITQSISRAPTENTATQASDISKPTEALSNMTAQSTADTTNDPSQDLANTETDS